MKAWSPYSWQGWPIAQSVNYHDAQAFTAAVDALGACSPLVLTREIDALKALLVKAGLGQAFIIQGGDCCELFSECESTGVVRKLEILHEMSEVLQTQLSIPMIKIGRMAGQYAKPRSSDTEIVSGEILPVYRGDMINAYDFHQEARRPDPLRMVHAYQYAQKTLEYIKNHDASVFVSHEALHLPYEAALTREDQGRFYNLSTHLPWLGMRTLDAGGAHVEYLRGIQNPIGIKVGPENVLPQVLKVIEILNPQKEAGKIVLIHRFGRCFIDERLPDLLSAVKDFKVTVICDPMHGNTCMNSQGLKTRYFDDIVAELRSAFKIHQAYEVPLAGIHFEMTGEHVTECVGGMEHDLAQRIYTSRVDPRLNHQQAVAMARSFVGICQGV